MSESKQVDSRAFTGAALTFSSVACPATEPPEFAFIPALNKGGEFPPGLNKTFKTYTKNGDLLQNFILENGVLFDEKDTPISGQVALIFDNGQNYSVGNYIAGKEDGLFKIYNENGNLIEESNFKNGSEDDAQKKYYETGELKSTRVYQNDEEIEYKIYGKQGFIVFDKALLETSE